jgi:hypothetical protein
MYKNTYFAPIEKTTDTRISPPPIKPNFGVKIGIKKRPADTNFFTPEAKKKCISQ